MSAPQSAPATPSPHSKRGRSRLSYITGQPDSEEPKYSVEGSVESSVETTHQDFSVQATLLSPSPPSTPLSSVKNQASASHGTDTLIAGRSTLSTPVATTVHPQLTSSLATPEREREANADLDSPLREHSHPEPDTACSDPTGPTAATRQHSPAVPLFVSDIFPDITLVLSQY